MCHSLHKMVLTLLFSLRIPILPLKTSMASPLSHLPRQLVSHPVALWWLTYNLDWSPFPLLTLSLGLSIFGLKWIPRARTWVKLSERDQEKNIQICQFLSLRNKNVWKGDESRKNQFLPVPAGPLPLCVQPPVDQKTVSVLNTYRHFSCPYSPNNMV